MFTNDHDTGSAGRRIGIEAASDVNRCTEEFVTSEHDRIALVNEPQIAALSIEGRELTERTSRLEERQRRMVPPSEARSARRRKAYYAILGASLIVAAFVFNLIGFDPYRLGKIAILYSLGITLATPFAVDEFLNLWKNEWVLKITTTVVFMAAIGGGMLLAAVRSDLLARTVADQAPAVAIEGAEPTATPPHSSFYETNDRSLRLLLVFFALAIDMGGGIALYRARTERVADEAEYETVTRELTAGRARLAEVTRETIALRNAPDIFVAGFWRDFSEAVLTHTLRGRVTKWIMFGTLTLTLLSGRACGSDFQNVAVAFDLSISESRPSADGKSPFDRNVAGVTRLIETLGAGSRITIIGITANSIADPTPILAAQLSADPGYFGERLASGRKELVRSWRARAARLVPSAKGTDIIGAFFLASEIFRKTPESRNLLVVYSDMRHSTAALNLEKPLAQGVDAVVKDLDEQGQIANLAGVAVYICGANGGGNDLPAWQNVRQFWMGYFARAGARCEGYSMLATPTMPRE